ncbi:UNVERIFIED_CONTAM: hypothetical protein K2H54_048509 [Gekko kuhli]
MDPNERGMEEKSGEPILEPHNEPPSKPTSKRATPRSKRPIKWAAPLPRSHSEEEGDVVQQAILDRLLAVERAIGVLMPVGSDGQDEGSKNKIVSASNAQFQASVLARLSLVEGRLPKPSGSGRAFDPCSGKDVVPSGAGTTQEHSSAKGSASAPGSLEVAALKGLKTLKTLRIFTTEIALDLEKK